MSFDFRRSPEDAAAELRGPFGHRHLAARCGRAMARADGLDHRALGAFHVFHVAKMRLWCVTHGDDLKLQL